MPAKDYELDEQTTLKLYKRKGARSIRLSISAGGEVRVTMPTWTPYAVGARFAAGHRDWIAQQLSARRAPLLTHRQSIGKTHTLYFVADASLAKPATRLSSTIVRVSHPSHMTAGHPEVQAAAHKAGLRALRQQAEQQLPPRLRELAEQHGFDFNSVGVKRLTGRWGSCDARRDIILNLYLMQLPWTLIDYVLLHELTHTEVLRHGPDFWRVMQQHLPDVKVRRLAIRRYRPVITGAAPDGAVA